LLGAIIGDIVGSRFEFDNHRSKDFELFTEDCQVTDDSIMTLAVAKAIMEADKITEPSHGRYGYDSEFYLLVKRMTIKYLQEIGRRYPNCGYGGRFSGWIFSDDPRPYNSFGNGAAMRISPVGFASRTESEVCRLSEVVTGVSHDHCEGLKGAEATAVAIYMARRGFTKGEILDKIKRNYYELDFKIDDIRDTYKFNETCQETVPQAIQAFLESTSFEDAIRTAISLGGDSDTLAAITGSIAEAYYGVPQDLKDKALNYLDSDLRAIYDEWYAFLGKI
jgi:type I restriction enzyme M protein